MKGIDPSRTPYSLGHDHPPSVALSRREMVSLLGSGVLCSGLAACSRQTAREAPPAQLQDELYYSSTVGGWSLSSGLPWPSWAPITGKP